MKITFLGTGAADWDINSRKDGEFFRRCTSAMINDDLLIDFNNDTIDYIEKNNLDVKNVKNILITHTHSDHFSAAAINNTFGRDTVVVCDAGAQERIKDVYIGKKTIPLYTKTAVGGYTVIAVEANHSVANSTENPLHYIISDGEKCIFWGCDGAWLLNKSWHEIRSHKYDLAVFDGTLFDEEGDYRIFEHNNLKMITEMCATFRSLELMKESSQIMISHMSKYSQYPHEKLEEYLKPYGIISAYDGLEVTL